VADQVRQSQAELGDRGVLLGTQATRGEAAEVQQLPEAVAGRLVVVVSQLGAFCTSKPTEDDDRIRSNDVRQDLHETTFSTSELARGRGVPRIRLDAAR
jgi:hypothetical protein